MFNLLSSTVSSLAGGHAVRLLSFLSFPFSLSGFQRRPDDHGLPFRDWLLSFRLPQPRSRRSLRIPHRRKIASTFFKGKRLDMRRDGREAGALASYVPWQVWDFPTSPLTDRTARTCGKVPALEPWRLPMRYISFKGVMMGLAPIYGLLTPYLPILPPMPHDFRTREVRIDSSNGCTLHGTLNLPGHPMLRPVVILAHTYRSDRSEWKPLVQRLNQAGIATLALDLRGHGKSAWRWGGKTPSGGTPVSMWPGLNYLPFDLVRAAAWVRQQDGIDARKVALAGAGCGATAALLAAPRVRAAAVLALSPILTPAAMPGMLDAAKQGPAAMLHLCSKDDPGSADIQAALAAVLGKRTSWIPGPTHGLAHLPSHCPGMTKFFRNRLTHFPGRFYATLTLPIRDAFSFFSPRNFRRKWRKLHFEHGHHEPESRHGCWRPSASTPSKV